MLQLPTTLTIIVLHLILTYTTTCYGKSWTFKNWQKFMKEEPSSDPEWKSAWGIPDDNGWSWPWHGDGFNYDIVKDPVGSEKGILKITYPENSMNPGADPQGGIGFYSQPISLSRAPRELQLSYQVYFPKGFDFVKGGKLPGLYGGHDECSGGTNSPTCFSTRFMWREDGQGEVYAYVPPKLQSKNICKSNGNICNSDYGYSLGRGSWKFKTGAWNKLQQKVVLNTPGKKNGVVTVFLNGRKVYQQKNLVLRTKKTKKIFGIAFDTFFGGSSEEFRTPKTQYSYFKDFALNAN
ncbi:unnamed protein product [Cunninghamella echinulata]